MMVISQSPNFLKQFIFAVASVKWEGIRMFLLIFLQSRCGIWQFIHIYRWSEGSWFVSIWIHKEPFIQEKRALSCLDSHGRPWVEETAKHLYSPTVVSRRGEFGFSWGNTGCYRRGIRKYCHLNLFLLWCNKGGLGFGSCESLGWSIIPFVVAEMPFLNSMFGQKFSNVALTMTSFYLVTLWEEMMGWNII